MLRLEVRKNAYYDSVTLMLISKDVKKIDGVHEALVGMGTELNREIAENLGLNASGFENVGPNDFFVAVSCEDDAVFTSVVAKVDTLINKKAESTANAYIPPTLDSALKIDPDLNMAVISVPGKFAAGVAQECLDRDIHVMLFSDNVTLEEELALKTYAAARELLVMGPDCGTAIIHHVPLAFANVVREGGIGIVAASGTGAQEVSCIIDRLGGGISQLIGTGGRDLKKEIGGIMMRQALQALTNDPNTKVLLLVSKPPASEVSEEILKMAAAAGKPVVVTFIGGDPEAIKAHGLYAGLSLEDGARKAVALLKGETPQDFTGFTLGMEEAHALARAEAANMAEGQKYMRGLFTGGTLCDEAMKLLKDKYPRLYSNIPLDPQDLIENARTAPSIAHTFLDFGDDAFTVGRPHPMIDPSLRAERVLQEGNDPETALILVDCVIGYGSHPDPAEDLAEAVRAAKANARRAGRYLSVIGSVTGTESDPQGLSKTQQKLEAAGMIVLPSNAQAARFASLVLRNIGQEGRI